MKEAKRILQMGNSRSIFLRQFSIKCESETDKAKQQERILNRGRSIDALMSYVPEMLHARVPVAVLNEQIVLRNATGSLSVTGRRKYVWFTQVSRLWLGLWFEQMHFGVMQVSSSPSLINGSSPGASHGKDELSVRWVFEGIPRYSRFMAAGPFTRSYEGIFVFTFDDHGLVKEHILQTIYPVPFWYGTKTSLQF